MWIVRDGDGRAITECGDDVDDDALAELFDTQEEAAEEAERLNTKYDTDGWFHTAWIPTLPEDFAALERLASKLFPKLTA